MSELETILQATLDWARMGKRFALATVVGVRGSTYRQLGARQLMAEDGYSVGTVSGGCLDQDLHRVAREVLASGAPRLVEFDLTADDEAIWGWGIGCNGATELLVVPSDHAGRWAEEMAAGRARHRTLAVVHELFGPRFSKLYVQFDGSHTGRLCDDSMGRDAIGVARSAIAEGESRVVAVERRRLLVEVVGAPRRLLICGAGHDADPVIQYAAELGFEVVVTDERPALLTAQRFPSARLVSALPSELGRKVELDQRTYAVIMSHNYLRDLDYLRSLLGTKVPYIGALGPGARLERLVVDLAESGCSPSPEDLAKMHGPAGLDIGAEGPKEIAWAIMAEILAVRRSKAAGFLRDRKGPDYLRRL
ncbi:MAG: XdhC family protein [Actinomycetia bacterium]|nr:XdhC family protein [Actinomycetes bacterium]